MLQPYFFKNSPFSILLGDLLPDNIHLTEEKVRLAESFLFSSGHLPDYLNDTDWRETLTYLKNVIRRNHIDNVSGLLEYYDIKEEKMAAFLAAGVNPLPAPPTDLKVMKKTQPAPYVTMQLSCIVGPLALTTGATRCLGHRESFVDHAFSPDRIDVSEEDSEDMVCCNY